ncbi:heme lyase subunit NrfE [Salmonella enterica subsp. enterica]|uniref:Heme lyase subunit NrfE n=1 Tax=Salmonella enterica I TaxID=59201 RepID=A0A447MZL2_SALET|nr:heme lyase subunit NrfE [Salmonella enterica subsp. enterica]
MGGGKCETLILTTLLLFSAVLLIVLVGTLYPMIYGLMGWGRLSVGAPYFNRVTLPFGLLIAGSYRAGDNQKPQSLCGVVSFRHCWRIRAYLSSPPGSWFPAAVGMKSALTSAPVSRWYWRAIPFVSSVWILEAKGNYTSEKARITLWRNEKRIGSLQPERRFYAARRQQMMEPGIHWNLLHDWYAVMGEKTGPDRYAMRLYVQTGVRWIWGGGLLMVCGALLSGMAGEEAS